MRTKRTLQLSGFLRAVSGSTIVAIIVVSGGSVGNAPPPPAIPDLAGGVLSRTAGGVTGPTPPFATSWRDQGSWPKMGSNSRDLPGPVARQAPLAVCFAPGTPPEVIAAVNQAIHIAPGPLRYYLDGRWWPYGQGSPTTLTWSFVPDGLSIHSAGSWDNNGNAGPSELFSRMDSLFGNRTWVSKIEACFARWEELTGVSYIRITYQGYPWDDGATWGTGGDLDQERRGDIRIAMRNIDGSSGGVLAYNYFPSAGDMMIDRWGNWDSSSNDYRFLRNVVMHEHGHGLGLHHVCSSDTGQLLEPYINTSFDGPQHDDLRAGQRHYGDPFEVDDSPAEATHLGTASMGAPLTAGAVPDPAIPHGALLSIDGNEEEDWFRFTATAAYTLATVAVIPRGYVYDSSSQEPNGDCNYGNYIDSLSMADLNVQLLDTDGITVLGTGDSTPAGMTETLSEVMLPAPGDYYIRVFEGDAPTESQLYELELSIILPGACCLADAACAVASEGGCHSIPGAYMGHGTTCPPDPPCVPVDTVMTGVLGASVAFPGTSVPLELLVTEAGDLMTYQVSVMITRTSGEGTLEVDCPEGAQIDESRPDFVFAGLSVIPATACEYLQLGAVTLSGSATVGSAWKYLGDFTLDISAETTPGTTFEVAVVPDPGQSFLRDSMARGIMVRYGQPATLTVVDAGNVRKNRYVSFSPDPSETGAYQVEMTASTYFPDSTGILGWVGEPDGLGISRVVDEPVFRLWTESAVHVGDCEIVPVATYAIRRTPDGVYFEDPFVRGTITEPGSKKWGDVVGEFTGTEWSGPNGVVNMDDVMAAVQRFKQLETAPPLTWVDVNEEVPDGVLNFTDILRIVQGFKGEPYPFSDPVACP